MDKESLTPIPVVDLFAGPGGLSEGFSRYPLRKRKRFKIAISIEKEPNAHKTLTLRAFFRQFEEGKAPDAYYQYIRGEITKDELFEKYPIQAKAACKEAHQLVLGEGDPNPLIAEKLAKANHWVLIGGPPCQAYSLVGRSKLLGNIKRTDSESEEEFNLRKFEQFNSDARHVLYRQYLAIISKHWPSIFVMENVRGILSSKFNNELIFPKILNDLRNPGNVFPSSGHKYSYRIFSLTTDAAGNPDNLQPSDFLIRAEDYGIPQARHRVILLGIRDDLAIDKVPLLTTGDKRSVREAIGSLPKLTPGLSKDSESRPYDALYELIYEHLIDIGNNCSSGSRVRDDLYKMIEGALKRENRGGRFVPSDNLPHDRWYRDSQLDGYCNHETRSHIREDLWRYAFASCYARIHKVSPLLRDFPPFLLPDHKNVQDAIDGLKFGDRFRVQLADKPSSTITSHISKDGHYFIHYDPRQYRSLTVREAARLQTFPDNYFFEGPRTSQYQQVGNAVPPLLAYKIAKIVAGLIDSLK